MKTGADVLNEILNELNLRAPTLAKNIGLPHYRLSDIQTGRVKKISGEMAHAINKRYPQYSIEYLLTGEELQKIKDLQLEGHLAKARDLFLLGCYTAMRFSDYSRIKKSWIKGNNIVFTEEKTGNRNLIPLSPAAREIITRYKGAPRLSQQKLNEYIKEVCKLAGITDKVELTYTKGGLEVRRAKPKCDLVSTHTARRTGATLLVKAGAPIAWVMKVTGHKSEKSFMRYIRLSSEEYAELVRSYVDAL